MPPDGRGEGGGGVVTYRRCYGVIGHAYRNEFRNGKAAEK